MQRTQHYETSGSHTGMKDLETWLGNSLATLLSALAIAGAVIGWFVAMGYITHSASLTDFEGGMAWMVPSVILAIAANAFRREHHIVGPDEEPYRATGTTGRVIRE